jgi:hypothetical protein
MDKETVEPQGLPVEVLHSTTPFADNSSVNKLHQNLVRYHFANVLAIQMFFCIDFNHCPFRLQQQLRRRYW